MDIGDQEFEKAMEKQLSSLEKKPTRTSSMGGTMPRLGAPDPPKLSTPQKQTETKTEKLETEVSDKEETNLIAETKDETQEETEKKKKKKVVGDRNGEYSDDFDTDSEDEISKVRDENNKFIQEKFEIELKTLTETSELPNLNDIDFEEYIKDQKEVLKERADNHTEWMSSFIKKKESILYRLGLISKSRNNRFTEVCNISCRLMDTAPFSENIHRKSSISRSRSHSRDRSRGRSRSREKSSERSKERSRGRSRERSWVRDSKNNSDVLPEIVDLKEDILSSPLEEVVA